MVAVGEMMVRLAVARVEVAAAAVARAVARAAVARVEVRVAVATAEEEAHLHEHIGTCYLLLATTRTTHYYVHSTSMSTSAPSR